MDEVNVEITLTQGFILSCKTIFAVRACKARTTHKPTRVKQSTSLLTFSLASGALRSQPAMADIPLTTAIKWVRPGLLSADTTLYGLSCVEKVKLDAFEFYLLKGATYNVFCV